MQNWKRNYWDCRVVGSIEVFDVASIGIVSGGAFELASVVDFGLEFGLAGVAIAFEGMSIAFHLWSTSHQTVVSLSQSLSSL